MKRADIKSMNFNTFLEKIKRMDDAIFGNRDLVESMVAYSTRDQAYVCFPSKQEAEMLQAYVREGGDIGKLSPADQAFLRFSQIEDIEQRFVLKRFMFVYEERKPYIQDVLTKFQKAVNDIYNSIKFKKVLATIIQLARLLDHRPFKGFKLSSINKITTVKPNDVFFFDYIADYVQEKCQLGDFYREFDSLFDVKDVSLSELSLELNQWSITVHSMKETIERYPGSNLIPFLKVFIDSHGNEIEVMMRDLNDLIEKQRHLCKYLGEDLSISERILSIVYQFGQTFRTYYDKKEQKRQRELRRAEEQKKRKKMIKIKVNDEFLRRLNATKEENNPTSKENKADSSTTEKNGYQTSMSIEKEVRLTKSTQENSREREHIQDTTFQPKVSQKTAEEMQLPGKSQSDSKEINSLKRTNNNPHLVRSPNENTAVVPQSSKLHKRRKNIISFILSRYRKSRNKSRSKTEKKTEHDKSKKPRKKKRNEATPI